jgi:hypothetical protein
VVAYAQQFGGGGRKITSSRPRFHNKNPSLKKKKERKKEREKKKKQ